MNPNSTKLIVEVLFKVTHDLHRQSIHAKHIYAIATTTPNKVILKYISDEPKYTHEKLSSRAIDINTTKANDNLPSLSLNLSILILILSI